MTNDRVIEVVEDLEQTLLEFIRKRRITHDEYRKATEIIAASIKGGEESLLFDVFFEAEATEVGNTDRVGSPAAIEGPFYVPGTPLLSSPNVMPQRPGERGDILIFRGRVTSTEGEPLADAELDMWQADADGLYSNIHPGIPDWNLRGRFRTDAEGAFAVRTILPPPYEIPKDGPTGTVLNALGRHFFRPAHLHLKLRHPGSEELTSQLYFEGGDYLTDDVANAVRDGLVVRLVKHDEPVRHVPGLTDAGLGASWLEATYEFRLEPARAI
jgi:catechol 1,2-dioxygenase